MWCSSFYNFLASLPWPIAVAFSVFLFRKQLVDILPRVREAGPTGVKLDPVKEQENKPLPSTTDRMLPAPRPNIDEEPSFSAALGLFRSAINRDLFLLEESDRQSALVDSLAKTKLELFFERIYRLAFGSQIVALRRLDEQGEAQISQARSFFETYEKENPTAYIDYGFDGWSNFIISNGLAERDEDKIKSTALGHQFLLYLTALRLTERKAL